MEEEDQILERYLQMLLCAAAYIRERKKRIRRYSVRPINRFRQEKGMFKNFIKSMIQHDHDGFFKYTKMTLNVFDNLLRLVGNHLQKDKTKNPLPPAQRLIITLHYLAEGCSMHEIAREHYIGHATVSIIIKETTDVLWNVLSPIYLKEPGPEEWLNISTGFFNRLNMPNCIGAVDGKHVSIQAPKFTGSENNQSIALMACCDAFHKFIFVDVGAAGSNHESIVFKESGFGSAILNNRLPLPAEKELPKTEILLPHFFIADAAFPLNEHIMRPYPGQKLLKEKQIFNNRLSRARGSIENAYGILVQRWRILTKPIIANISTCESSILATVVLHNFIQKSEEDIPELERKYCPVGYTDTYLPDGTIKLGAWRDEGPVLKSVGRLGANNSKTNVRINRDKLCGYFNSEVGSVPWQTERLHDSVKQNPFCEFVTV